MRGRETQNPHGTLCIQEQALPSLSQPPQRTSAFSHQRRAPSAAATGAAAAAHLVRLQFLDRVPEVRRALRSGERGKKEAYEGEEGIGSVARVFSSSSLSLCQRQRRCWCWCRDHPLGGGRAAAQRASSLIQPRCAKWNHGRVGLWGWGGRRGRSEAEKEEHFLSRCRA